jgi:sterol desaturase/sphingolipid hydroxylase (fatty acid hydroxylase superfamily)
VHPAAPFIFYIPIVSGLLGWGLWTHVTTPLYALPFFAVGWVIWDVMEYGIHRGFFHWEGSGPITRRIHEIAHGYHHKYPDDPLRLVMPLGASIPLASLIGLLLWLCHAPAVTLPIFCGIVSSYLFYDFTHWSTHYRTPKTAWGKAIRAHHMAHHFAALDKNFGISHRWIDVVFGTLRKRQARE